MPGDHPVKVTAARDRKLEPHPESVQRRVAASNESHRRRCGSHTPEVVVVLPRAEGNVVTEPLRLFVGVGVAPDIDEQCGVVHGRAFAVVQPDAIREPERDRALAQHMLHRLSEAEVDPERQRRDKLG